MSASSLERKFYKLFGRRLHSPPSPSPQRSAITALCRQALTVDVDTGRVEVTSDDTPRPGSSSPVLEGRDRRAGRSRFLDTTWLQKPKKFFKVSK